MTRLEVVNFRNHEAKEVDLQPGPVVLTGPNGSGKTSLLEAFAWCSTLRSHRASSASPLIRMSADEAVVRCTVQAQARELVLETSLVRKGRARARRNGTELSRPRELLGNLSTVLFAPEDLSLVRGDPAGRRSFLDDLLVQLAPRVDALRSDLDRVVRQRTALLRSGGSAGGGRIDEATLRVWDDQLVHLGSELTALRLRLIRDIRPLLRQAHEAVAGHDVVDVRYESRWAETESGDGGALPAADELQEAFRRALRERAREEYARGMSLVGPQRDDLALAIQGLPARTHSSHGEAWSLALAARLATAALLRAQGEDPVVLLDDVFAELDQSRRQRLAEVCVRFEQVVASAAVVDDVPQVLRRHVIDVESS